MLRWIYVIVLIFVFLVSILVLQRAIQRFLSLIVVVVVLIIIALLRRRGITPTVVVVVIIIIIFVLSFPLAFLFDPVKPSLTHRALRFHSRPFENALEAKQVRTRFDAPSSIGHG